MVPGLGSASDQKRGLRNAHVASGAIRRDDFEDRSTQRDRSCIRHGLFATGIVTRTRGKAAAAPASGLARGTLPDVSAIQAATSSWGHELTSSCHATIATLAPPQLLTHHNCHSERSEESAFSLKAPAYSAALPCLLPVSFSSLRQSLVPQSIHRVQPRGSHRRQIASRQRNGRENHGSHNQCRGVVRFQSE